MRIADIGIIKRNLYFRYLAMRLELEMFGDFPTFVTVVAVVSHNGHGHPNRGAVDVNK